MKSWTSSLVTVGSSSPSCRLQVGDGDAVELLQLGIVADLVVALDDVDVVAVGGDFRQADPTFTGLFERIANGAHSFDSGL